ncbi:MAG: cob(I)yrinic acid a,c-diamide adenosyltransferase [Lachnospiraceae bacterium]|nr:cob(I)yrinic acid a,c-diamide adenosyltransferase [Lachnospiraceae bacterium]
MKIYTKSGDRMTTGLLDGTRVSKHDERIHLLGNIDELNSMLGVVKSLTEDQARKEDISNIQRTLIRMMSGIAEASEKRTESNAVQDGKYLIEEEDIAHLEEEIDRMESLFEREKDFVLPGGSFYSAQIDVARTVARRCERWFAQAAEEYALDAEAASYLNRLSDYLYVTARYTDACENEKTQQLHKSRCSQQNYCPHNISAEREKKALTAEMSQNAVDRLHKKLNHSYATFYTFCVCDADGRQLATNAIEHHSVALSEAQRAAVNALERTKAAALRSNAAAESISAVPGSNTAAGMRTAAAPEDGGAALYASGLLLGSVGVYGSYKKDINEKAQMLVDSLLDVFVHVSREP